MRKLVIESQIDCVYVVGQMPSDEVEHVATVRRNERGWSDYISLRQPAPSEAEENRQKQCNDCNENEKM